MIPIKVVCFVIAVLLLSDVPRCRLAEALELLPRERFSLPAVGSGPLPPDRTVVVLSDRLTTMPKTGNLPPRCPAILSGQCQAAAQFAQQTELLPLDCGLSLRDTLTLSSSTESSAVVSLQRPVVRLDGSPVEPVEVPLTLTRRWEPYPLLCCAGVLLLAGGPAALLEATFF